MSTSAVKALLHPIKSPLALLPFTALMVWQGIRLVLHHRYGLAVLAALSVAGLLYYIAARVAQFIRDFRARCSPVILTIAPGEAWPTAVSDGVGLPCSDCGEVPLFDYHVTDEFWNRHVPETPARLSVICLPCLDRRCAGVGLAAALEFVQWTGTGHTIELLPARRFEYERNGR